jgi:hypothetical protein
VEDHARVAAAHDPESVVNGRDRRPPFGTDPQQWAQLLADLDRLVETADPHDAYDEALRLASAPLDLTDDDEEGEPEEETPEPEPATDGLDWPSRAFPWETPADHVRRVEETRGQTASVSPHEPLPRRGRRGPLAVIDLAHRRVLTAGGALVHGGWPLFERAERQRAKQHRTLTAAAIPKPVVTTATSTNGTTTTTVTTVTTVTSTDAK